MTIEQYIILRQEKQQSLQQIQGEHGLSEATIWTLELGYQCFLRKLPLDEAIKIVSSIQVIEPTRTRPTSFTPPKKYSN